MKNQLRAVIVDDERIARKNLQEMLAEHPEIQVVAEADSIQKAIEVIEDLEPDVVFLDIQMPGGSGFDLLDKIEANFKVIFVTAFDEYAIRAFEVNALDYLLKPVEPERLTNAIKRLFEPAAAENAITIRKEIKTLTYYDRIFLKMGNSPRFLKVSLIKCICAERDYSEVWTADGKKNLVFMLLNEWEKRLPERYFSRIHRSTIINLEYVDRVEDWFNYSYQVYLRDIKEPFIMSRRYAAKLKEKLR
jgi:two-component system LytT family response regulator